MTDDDKPTGECRWFALCDRPAVGWRPHPILGRVACCEKHLTWEGE